MFVMDASQKTVYEPIRDPDEEEAEKWVERRPNSIPGAVKFLTIVNVLLFIFSVTCLAFSFKGPKASSRTPVLNEELRRTSTYSKL